MSENTGEHPNPTHPGDPENGSAARHADGTSFEAATGGPVDSGSGADTDFPPPGDRGDHDFGPPTGGKNDGGTNAGGDFPPPEGS